ncbi:Hydroxyethylthiazole kinase [Leucoagaricus sp. SymC.cos]|nr:Hydroxyethylthiazole kinase [Leucoagaricus sp. SymC.cos]
MSVSQARALPPKDFIIGISRKNGQHVKQAIEDDVDYIGIGVVWGTQTKINNNVVATQSANITLALGASPIMVTGPEEMEDLERITRALLINIGTLVVISVEGMYKGVIQHTFHPAQAVLQPRPESASSFRLLHAEPATTLNKTFHDCSFYSVGKSTGEMSCDDARIVEEMSGKPRAGRHTIAQRIWYVLVTHLFRALDKTIPQKLRV